MTEFKLGDEVVICNGSIIGELDNDGEYFIEFHGGDASYIKASCIKPSEPEEPTQPITKENIREVLEYNDIFDFSCTDYCLYKKIFCNRSNESSINFANPKWLQHLEVEVGKLKGLPMPKHEPHWVITKDGVEIGKIIASKQTFWGESLYENFYKDIDKLIPIKERPSIKPDQRKDKESDFTILFEDGSIAYAKWVK